MTTAIDTKRLEELGLIKRPELKKEELGQDDFLSLMTAQLQNQDPMKPMDNGDFLGQIAQFSQVRGIQNLEATFNKLADSLYSNQAFQAASLVGKSVVVPGSTGVLLPGKTMDIVVPLDKPVEQLTIEIKNSAGQIVQRLASDKLNAGDIEVAWDGKDLNGAPVSNGNYTVKATAMIGGQSVGVDTFVVAPIESVPLGKGDGKLEINLAGLGKRPFSEVRTIR